MAEPSAGARGCGICGWPVAPGAGGCEACGAPRGASAPGADAPPLPELDGAPRERPEDHPALENAFAAWRARDFSLVVRECLSALGVRDAKSAPGAWSFLFEGRLFHVALDAAAGELHVESPVARLAASERVPMMRWLLESNAGAILQGQARFFLRGDLAVMAFTDRIEKVSPPRLVAAIRAVAAGAVRGEELVSVSFGARRFSPEVAGGVSAWELLGSPVRLATVQGIAAPMGAPQADAEAATETASHAAAETAAETTDAAAAEPERPPVEITVPTEPIAVDVSAAADDGDELLVVPESEDGGDEPGEEDDEGEEVLIVPDFPESLPEFARATLAAAGGTPLAQVELERRAVQPRAAYRSEHFDEAGPQRHKPLARAPLPSPPPSSARAKSAEAVCKLLRQSLDLARPLPSHNVHGSIEWLLVRATVFRLHDEQREAAPGAAALLGRLFAPLMEVTWSALGSTLDPSQGSIESELALATLDVSNMHAMFKEIVVKNAEVGEQAPWRPEPIKKLTAVRSLVDRWLEAVEMAPADLALRHFLLLGGIAEVLSRAQFAQWLQQRLRTAEAEGRRSAISEKSNRRLVRALKGLRA